MRDTFQGIVKSNPVTKEKVRPQHRIKGLRDGYNLFVWMGHLSHVNNVKRISNIEWHGGVSRLNIKIRLLKGISFATGKQIDIKEIGGGSEPVKIPIHRIDSKSKWISETVEVGILDRLTHWGIDNLMGNDLAGWKIDITHLLRQVEKRCVPRSDSDQK